MRIWSRWRILALMFLAVVGMAGPVQAVQRLTVFEGFLRNTCNYSAAAGDQMTTLETEFSSQPVLFLEYDVDASAYGSRQNRWWTAHGAGSVSLPLIMVDGGNQFSNGPVDIAVYRSMVNASLPRPAGAAITGSAARQVSKVGGSFTVTNTGSSTLSPANGATVWMVVYEDFHAVHTDRYVRGLASTAITSLAPGASTTFTLQSPDLSPNDWSKLNAVALVDYRPGGSSGPFDTLQAATFPVTGTAGWRSGETDLSGGWKWSSWLGYYNVNSAPWVYHQEHRWLYAVDDGSGGVHFYYNDMATFVWTKPATYPYLYRFGSAAGWLWYLKGSTSPRWFYNLTGGAWESLP